METFKNSLMTPRPVSDKRYGRQDKSGTVNVAAAVPLSASTCTSTCATETASTCASTFASIRAIGPWG